MLWWSMFDWVWEIWYGFVMIGIWFLWVWICLIMEEVLFISSCYFEVGFEMFEWWVGWSLCVDWKCVWVCFGSIKGLF